MCVIVSKPPTAQLDEARARRLWTRNPHGGGFAFMDNDNRVQVQKAMEFDEYWHRYKSALGRNPNAHFVLHMRIATSGSIGLDNVHPFQVDEHTVMAHNGIINIETAREIPADFKPKGKYMDDPWDRSDTRIFIEEVLRDLPPNWLDNEHLVSMVEKFIGGSKLTFLTSNPELQHGVYILNGNQGTTRDGMWFSNSHGVDEGWKSYDSYAYGWGDDWTPEPVLAKRTAPKTLQKIYKENGREVEVHISSKTFEDYLKQVRKDNHLYLDIEYMATYGTWICFDCEEEVECDTERVIFGECGCWDKWCRNCDSAPYDCQCNGTERDLVSAWEPDGTWGGGIQEDTCEITPEPEYAQVIPLETGGEC